MQLGNHHMALRTRWTALPIWRLLHCSWGEWQDEAGAYQSPGRHDWFLISGLAKYANAKCKHFNLAPELLELGLLHTEEHGLCYWSQATQEPKYKPQMNIYQKVLPVHVHDQWQWEIQFTIFPQVGSLRGLTTFSQIHSFYVGSHAA